MPYNISVRFSQNSAYSKATIEKARKILDKGETFGALLTDLSKAFDCMTLDLLIAKLHALNFDMNAHNLIFDYLTNYLIEEADIMSYADDNTLHMCSKNVDVTLEKLEEVGKALFEWFSNNFLNVNADKCHLILSTDEPFSINIDNEVIKNSNNKKLLEINLYNELGFDTHVANICNRASKKLHALVRISQFMTQPA